jgi:hypothetical protein
MKILVPRITNATTQNDLREFANRVLHKWLRWPFSEHPVIVSCQILLIKDSVGVTERHGLLEVKPDDAALKVIRKLNGGYLRGKRVGVTHYNETSARAIGGLR